MGECSWQHFSLLMLCNKAVSAWPPPHPLPFPACTWVTTGLEAGQATGQAMHLTRHLAGKGLPLACLHMALPFFLCAHFTCPRSWSVSGFALPSHCSTHLQATTFAFVISGAGRRDRRTHMPWALTRLGSDLLAFCFLPLPKTCCVALPHTLHTRLACLCLPATGFSLPGHGCAWLFGGCLFPGSLSML